MASCSVKGLFQRPAGQHLSQVPAVSGGGVDVVAGVDLGGRRFSGGLDGLWGGGLADQGGLGLKGRYRAVPDT